MMLARATMTIAAVGIAVRGLGVRVTQESQPGGGGQAFAERLKAEHVQHGAPAHPLHKDRQTVRSGQVGTAAFSVGSAPTEQFSHFFETCVGSGHMSLTLREDWRNHIRMAARDLGVKHIRGHGLLDDDMSVSTTLISSASFRHIIQIWCYMRVVFTRIACSIHVTEFVLT